MFFKSCYNYLIKEPYFVSHEEQSIQKTNAMMPMSQLSKYDILNR